MRLSMFSPRGGGPGIVRAIRHFSLFSCQIPCPWAKCWCQIPLPWEVNVWSYMFKTLKFIYNAYITINFPTSTTRDALEHRGGTSSQCHLYCRKSQHSTEGGVRLGAVSRKFFFSVVVLRFYKTSVLRYLEVFGSLILMRFAVFLCYSMRCLYVILCGFTVLVPPYAPLSTDDAILCTSHTVQQYVRPVSGHFNLTLQ